MNQPVCLFDSGIGGLTVLKKLIQKFPNENYIYLADLANVPYGDKSANEIKEIASGIIEWLSRFNPKLIIMACNASSSVLCEQNRINPASAVPLFGMIEASAKEIANNDYKYVSVWATKLVVENSAYKNLIQKHNPNIKVDQIACPKLVPMIEGLNFNSSEKNGTIQEYINKTSRDSQALILGCTHYPHIQDDLKELTALEIIDPADALLIDLEKHLIPRRDVARNVSTDNKYQISLYATAQTEKLERFSKIYLCGDFKVSAVDLKKVIA